MRRLLEGEGFTVQRAATAEAALEALNGTLPDLVIADYHLPAMNGDELVRRVRLNHRTRAIAVLMLTEARERSWSARGWKAALMPMWRSRPGRTCCCCASAPCCAAAAASPRPRQHPGQRLPPHPPAAGRGQPDPAPGADGAADAGRP
ncbi:response regulator [Pseudoroseomonas wenyumeiae]